MAQKTIKKSNYQKKDDSNSLAIKIFAIVSIIIFIGGGLMKSAKEGNGNIYITKSGYLATYEKENLEKLIRYINHNDNAAVNQLIYNGEAFELPSGQEADLMESEFSGKVKIRIKGETNEIWTVIDAIKSK